MARGKGRKHYSGKELLYMRALERQKKEEERRKNRIKAQQQAERNFLRVRAGFPAAILNGAATRIKAE
ncbi:MAG: hypothetical protein J6K15_05150 [Lachnospiraceae bacterium]|nr:hypothetical protein [Lachnospiraceae bacterium]